jgi:hypothetical protein
MVFERTTKISVLEAPFLTVATGYTYSAIEQHSQPPVVVLVVPYR